MSKFEDLIPPPTAHSDIPPRKRVLPPPSEPMRVARELVGVRFTGPGGELVLRRWRSGWWQWHGTRWIEVEAADVHAEAYRFAEHADYRRVTAQGDELASWSPNRRKIGDLIDALAAICFLPESVEQPCWIGDGRPSDGIIVACANGLLHVASRTLLPHSPQFFNTTAVPFDFVAEASRPTMWLEFLHQLWPADQEMIDALQEFFGYVISGRLDLHRILLMVGPTRGGKGIVSRVLGALVGPENVVGPSLSSLGGDFGLAPLIGKSLAVVSDARLNGQATTAVVERLLSVSGEDTITVNRKYREQWTGKLPCRFMVLSNELPHFGDAAAAIVGRFIVLVLTNSWLGKEDFCLEERLRTELPEILSWALDGLERLDQQGRFTSPAGLR
jgi:putative DNA primase/helicase